MRKYFPLVAFAAVAIISLAMAGLAFVAVQDATRIKFEATADDALNRIESRVDLNISLLVSTRAFFAAHGGDITREEFREFFAGLDVHKNFDGLRGIGLLGLAWRGEADALAGKLVRDHGSEFRIFPPSDADLRTPILLFEPLDETNSRGIGYDMFTEPARREAIQAALDTGQPRASGRVMVGEVTGSLSYPGFFVFSTLDLEPGTVAAAPESRTGGVLYTAFRTQDLFSAALEKFPVLPVHVQVFDGQPEAANLMFTSEAPANERFGEDFVATRQLLVAGRNWTVQFRPTEGFSPPSSLMPPIMLGIFGLFFAAGVAVLARYQDRAYDAMERLQEASEKSLLEKDLMLQEMKHRIKNSITRVLAIARQTASSAKDIGEFSNSFSARLQAMAASQDMLTRSRWQKADLQELLTIELKQVFGKELPEEMVNGPKVMLSETMTQALGLTFHELATNALKYGDAGNSTDTLTVVWRVERSGKAQFLCLDWCEKGDKPTTEPLKIGFGTKLIDLNITRELRGTIIRNYRPTGLDIEIRIPLDAPWR